MEETQAVSNGINTMKSELVRGKIIQNNRQPLNLRQKKKQQKTKTQKGKASGITHEKMKLELFNSSFIFDGREIA